ncbi:hypothetical protein CEXT_757281 [Caerostris extrusa]|uniref:Uncharacterized protein n=1 Tax=Caerostris extrusa TaxID=172846 RepID=A0AAV4NW36_CAEEX|nr:hypothetical protein CEXT_757281 [Caerostris extrusa]
MLAARHVHGNMHVNVSFRFLSFLTPEKQHLRFFTSRTSVDNKKEKAVQYGYFIIIILFSVFGLTGSPERVIESQISGFLLSLRASLSDSAVVVRGINKGP